MSGIQSTFPTSGVMATASSIVNAAAVAGTYSGFASYTPPTGAAITTHSTMTNGVEIAVVNISGKGVLNFFACKNTAALSVRYTLRINVDGKDIFNFQSNSIAQNNGYYVVGTNDPANANGVLCLDQIPFSTSLGLYITANSSSATATTHYIYRTS